MFSGKERMAIIFQTHSGKVFSGSPCISFLLPPLQVMPWSRICLPLQETPETWV